MTGGGKRASHSGRVVPVKTGLLDVYDVSGGTSNERVYSKCIMFTHKPTHLQFNPFREHREGGRNRAATGKVSAVKYNPPTRHNPVRMFSSSTNQTG